MKKVLFAFAAMTALFAPAAMAAVVEKDEGVLILTEANFD